MSQETTSLWHPNRWWGWLIFLAVWAITAAVVSGPIIDSIPKGRPGNLDTATHAATIAAIVYLVVLCLTYFVMVFARLAVLVGIERLRGRAE